MLDSIVRRAGRVMRQGGSAVFGLVGIALIVGGLLYVLAVERSTAIQDAASGTINLSRAFAEHMLRSIKAVDQSLMFVRENYARDSANFDLTAWARSAQAATDVTIQLSMVDAQGILRESNIDPNPLPMDLSDREHIRVQMDRLEDSLFISKPVIGRVSHRWSIQFTRKLFKLDGSFAGVVVLSLDPTYLSRFFQSIDLGRHGAITLLGSDGVVRAAARGGQPTDTDPAIGRSVPTEILMKDFSEPRKTQVSSIDFDGTRRITSFRRVQSYPLIVAVGVSEEDVLARYMVVRRNNYIIAGSLISVLLVVTLLMFLHQSRLARARESLRDSQSLYAEKSRLLETALEHMGQGILMVNGERRIQVFNRHAIEMLGVPPNLLAQHTKFDELLRWQWANREFGEGVDETLRQFILSGGISHEAQCYERTRPTGLTLEIRSTPLPDGGVVRTFTDVTQRKRTEADLRAARDQADSAARAKSEFLAMMSHEIRSPLSGLVGALDLLRQTALDFTQAHMTGLAHSSSLTLLSILNDILDFSKIEAGAFVLAPEPVDLRHLILDVCQPNALVAAEKHVTLNVRLEPGLPEVISADERGLGQILNNLLSNAVKFTQQGSIDVRVGLKDRRLQIQVEDSGCGMDGVTLARLFQPFTQADGSSSRMTGGTGLGLCISRRLAELMDGAITVVSQPGQGSCFTLTLPYVEASRVVLSAGIQTPEPTTPAAGLVVLLVDDDPTNRWLTKRQLETLGAVVDETAGGEAALARLHSTEYHLLLTDCHMPGMDGVSLTKAVRASGEVWQDIPIIGLTADVTAGQAQRCHAAGMNDVAYKPLKRAGLAQLLAEHAVAPATLVADVHSHSSFDEQEIFDPSAYADLFDEGDPDGPAWLDTYCRMARSHVSSLRGHLAQLDRPAILALSHQFVGSSLSVGANRLASAARRLEDAALASSPESMAALLTVLEAETARALTAIATVRGATAPANV